MTTLRGDCRVFIANHGYFTLLFSDMPCRLGSYDQNVSGNQSRRGCTHF